MDAEILHALWFDCHDLNDIERTLLQALAYHGSPCWPSVKRLSVMIRRTHRHTQRLLTQLEKKGYIIILVRRGRGHSNLYTINMTSKRHILGKIRHPGDVSKYDIQVSSELKEEQERKKEELLSHLGLTKGSAIWVAALNGQRK
jgi:MarR-like DNA-binding transcriptional regulator SgrR of sgrS sRNA